MSTFDELFVEFFMSVEHRGAVGKMGLRRAVESFLHRVEISGVLQERGRR